MKKTTTLVAIGLLFGLGYGIWHEVKSDIAPSSKIHVADNITPLFPTKPLPELQFLNQNGQLMTTADLAGSWHLMFLGYSHCPDICPILLKTMESVMPALQEYPVDFIFVTADPKQDSPEVLRQYLQQFNAGFVGLTSDEATLQTLIQTLGVFVSQGEDGKIDHQGVLFILNPEKEIVALMNSPSDAMQIATEVKQLIQS